MSHARRKVHRLPQSMRNREPVWTKKLLRELKRMAKWKVPKKSHG